MELKLAQSAKMEAVGQLAGGIAHDFNNLLTSIAGLADLLGERFEPTDPSQADVSELSNTVARGARLTRQLPTFGRQQPATSTVIDVSLLLEESVRMLRRVIPEVVELEVTKAQVPLFTRADRTQLEQVLLNLTLNARDAMPRGGRLQLALAAVEIGEDAQQEYPDVRPGAYVQLRIRDSGTGIAPATLARIFEPFFTTKPIGAGTGLGLAVVHGIVQNAGGFIHVRSSLGEGSTFEIHLPKTEPGETSLGTPPSPRRGGAETILLVEDDAVVLRLTRRRLELLGYKVECEERGDSAVRRIESGLAFDVLLTDVLLPGLDGHTLAARGRQLRPGLPVVFMSG
jgi:two-component system cell cycle sensor histidine kinase/response regulator CckA